MNTIRESTFKIVADHFGIPSVDEDAHLIDDLGGDPLDLIELVLEIEENFNVEICDEDVERIFTVQDVYECVKKATSNV